jgi:hypothetical protein
MAKTLPLILAAGAAVLLLGGKKKSSTSKLPPPSTAVAGWLSNLGYDPTKPGVITAFKKDWNFVRAYINAWKLPTPPQLPVSETVTEDTATVMLFIQQEIIPKRYAGSWFDLRSQAEDYYDGKGEPVAPSGPKDIPTPENCGERFSYLLTSASGDRSYHEPCLTPGLCFGEDREVAMDRAREVDFLVRKAWNILMSIESENKDWPATSSSESDYKAWESSFKSLPDNVVTLKSLLPEVLKAWQVVLGGACLLDKLVTAIEFYGQKWEG